MVEVGDARRFQTPLRLMAYLAWCPPSDRPATPSDAAASRRPAMRECRGRWPRAHGLSLSHAHLTKSYRALINRGKRSTVAITAWRVNWSDSCGVTPDPREWEGATGLGRRINLANLPRHGAIARYVSAQDQSDVLSPVSDSLQGSCGHANQLLHQSLPMQSGVCRLFADLRHKMIQLQARISDGVYQFDTLLQHPLRHDPVSTRHRGLGVPEQKAELLV